MNTMGLIQRNTVSLDRRTIFHCSYPVQQCFAEEAHCFTDQECLHKKGSKPAVGLHLGTDRFEVCDAHVHNTQKLIAWDHLCTNISGDEE